jgi:hypothetical protein
MVNGLDEPEPYPSQIDKKGKGREEIQEGPRVIPKSALIGKNKSLVTQLNITYPNQKNINKHDLKPLDNFFRSLKDEKDWMAFCKILFLYFEGVFSLTEFCKLYEEKF